jgi:hypothetical protein
MGEVKTPLSLEDIIQYELPPLLRRQHLNKDVIIGIVGDRGGGKGLSSAEICLLDYMLQNESCFANLQLKAIFDVDEETANKYGLQAGQATFEAKPLDKYKFLRFDPEYHDGVFYTQEFNIWLADARRGMSNLNLATDDVGQQLRKLRMAWVYDCIHESFVDPRIRDATDIFIRTCDTALTPEGLAAQQKQGLEFEWIIYPMTRKLTGWTYSDTGRTIGPIRIAGKHLWGIINTGKHEIREKYKANVGETGTSSIEIKESPEVVAARDRWGWVYDENKNLHDQGILKKTITGIYGIISQIKEKGFTNSQVGVILTADGKRQAQAPTSWEAHNTIIDKFDLNRGLILITRKKAGGWRSLANK